MAVERKPPADGPSLETYIETRFNLLTVLIDKEVEDLLVRIADSERHCATIEKTIETHIAHLTKLFEQNRDSAKTAIDKAEAAQAAHNVASNEWRGTLNDFKSTLVARPEFDRLDRDFAAYKLETSTKAGQYQGEKASAKESKETSMATLTLIVAAVSALVSIFVNKFV